jgi:hypothetical protein
MIFSILGTGGPRGHLNWEGITFLFFVQ